MRSKHEIGTGVVSPVVAALMACLALSACGGGSSTTDGAGLTKMLGSSGAGQRDLSAQEKESRIAAQIAAYRLDGLGDRRPTSLSGGQQQRVAVARALAGKPSILLADEPTGNLDSKNGEAVMDLLRELHREGATICMVTHDPRYAEFADRTIHLFDGQIVEETK